MAGVVNGAPDPDPTVLSDGSRVLVFYELIGAGNTLKLAKSAGKIVVTY